ncbi:solute carrier family 35 member G1 [Caerostris extrusa]|uniref:Solute carrier family 35 member G1 n=1 Tax=Caerostris extrusa TaxID=172846 RepID=A0AAV4VWZ6_CAEEX|nr:solute carrier family 35 member G1 [Caerostris extrusa]
MLSGTLYSLVSVIVKQMKNLHPGQLSVYRFVALLVLSAPQTVQCGENPLGPKDYRVLILLRAICGGGNIFFNFIAFRYLPLSEAIAIAFSVPVFVTVAARVFLKEPCGVMQSFSVILTIVGIIFTSKLPSRLTTNPIVYTSENVYGLLAAIAGVFFRAGQVILVRRMKSVHHTVITFNFGWQAMIGTAILTAILGDFRWHYCGIQGVYILLLGFLSFVGQTLQVMALQCEFAAPVSIANGAADLMLAFVWQIMLFRTNPDSFGITGAILVGISVIFVGLSKWISLMPENSLQRKRLKWIL